MRDTQRVTEFITAFTTDDPDLSIRLRDLIEEAGIECQLVRGLLAPGDRTARCLIEIRTDVSDMDVVSQIIDASTAIGLFGAVDPLPPGTIPLTPPAESPITN